MVRVHVANAVLAATAALVCASMPAAAQTPGLPALQNAFGNPGIAVAANVGGGFLGAAGALGIGSGKLQISAAAGAQRANGSTRGAYGARAAASVWRSSGGSLGVGAFAGVGGAPRTRTGTVVTNAAELSVPAGLSFGYQRPMGASLGVSAYVSPQYRWTRLNSDAAVSSGGAFRVAAGLDVAFSPSLGVTGGVELGSNAGPKKPTLWGAAVTYALGRR